MRHYRNPGPQYCQCHLRPNPAIESIPQLRARVTKEILRLCAHFNCQPSECVDYCSPASGRRPRRARKNPLRRWSRPLSAGLARAWMGEEIYPEDVPAPIGPAAPLDLPPSDAPHPVPSFQPQILVVGGDSSYIPAWMQHFSIMQIAQVDVDLERQLEDFQPDLILIFVKAEKPFRPTKHTFYKVRNYAKGNNTEQRQVPYITVNKGWSQVIQRATEQGLDWFSEAYPHQIYIPEEELQPRAPKAMTKGRSIVNIRRAAQFEAHGIKFSDIEYARTRYVNKEPSHCTLCGTKIKYQFRLMFDRPDQAEPIIFFPVGSVCIVDWVEAMPDSRQKLSFLKELQTELDKAEEVKAETKASPSEEKKIKAKLQRQEQSKQIKERNAERKRKMEERKAAKRKEREARKQERQSGSRAVPSEVEEEEVDEEIDEELPQKLQDKFRATQDEFGWD